MTHILATDVHLVQKGTSVVPERLPFDGVIVASQHKLTAEGRPVAVEGDRVLNTRPHTPSGGAFVRPPSNDGRLTSAGQHKLIVEGTPVACERGVLQRCDDVSPRTTLRVRNASRKLVLGPNCAGSLRCNP